MKAHLGAVPKIFVGNPSHLVGQDGFRRDRIGSECPRTSPSLYDAHAHLELTPKGSGIETHIDLFVVHSLTEVVFMVEKIGVSNSEGGS